MHKLLLLLFLISWAFWDFCWCGFIYNNKFLKMQHLNAHLDINFHGNSRLFRALGHLGQPYWVLMLLLHYYESKTHIIVYLNFLLFRKAGTEIISMPVFTWQVQLWSLSGFVKFVLLYHAATKGYKTFQCGLKTTKKSSNFYSSTSLLMWQPWECGQSDTHLVKLVKNSNHIREVKKS